MGTPGRVCALLESGALPPDRISMLVLDEADSLLSDSFAEDVEWVHGVLPRRKQVRMPDKGGTLPVLFIRVHSRQAETRGECESSKDPVHVWPNMPSLPLPRRVRSTCCLAALRRAELQSA